MKLVNPQALPPMSKQERIRMARPSRRVRLQFLVPTDCNALMRGACYGAMLPAKGSNLLIHRREVLRYDVSPAAGIRVVLQRRKHEAR